VFICSSDKDCRQLLSERVNIFNLRKLAVFDRDALWKDWEVTPEQVIDLQTLTGDSVDNVPGVPGIGVKTAAKLLQQYQTLDNLMAHVDEISGEKRRESLRAAAATLDLSRQLVRLATDVPLELTWDEWRLRDWDAPRLLELYRGWGFRRFADQVAAEAAKQLKARGKKVRRGEVQGKLFAEMEENDGPEVAAAVAEGPVSEIHLAPGWQATYHLVATPEQLETFCSKIQGQTRLAVDLETTSLDPSRAEIVGYAFCWQPGEAWYIAVRGPKGEALLGPDTVLARLRPILEDPGIAKINQNIKFDLMVLRQHGVNVQGVAGDSMIADYLLHAGARNHNMQTLAQAYLSHQVIPITALLGKGKNQLTMDQVAPARIAIYSGEDADVAFRLCGLLEKQIADQGLKQLYDGLEVPLIDVLGDLERTGIRIDVPRLEHMGAEMAAELAKLEAAIHQLAGREFNIASLKQLREVLFDELKLPVRRKTGITGDASTNQETLEWLAAQGHKLPKLLVEHRQLAKLKGTYVDTLPALVNPRTGRIHASFNQTVAATGRLSSSDPNLQNIPIRSEQGGQVRQAFIPAEGWRLLTADYSQIELRLLAHFAQDEALLHAFVEDHDIHALVAAQVFGVAEAEVTSEMRRFAKTVNFGVLYGMSAFGLAQRLQVPRAEAARFIDAYFARYAKVLDYQNRLIRTGRERGYVATILGRRRAFEPALLRPDSSYQQRNQPEREAINMQIQGSAADLIKVAMLSIHRRLKAEKWQARMLLQIHDELVFEAPPNEVEPVARLVVEEMTGALGKTLQVPLKVDVGVGPNWLDTEDLHL
jgi:DNA polymerase-1